MNHFAQLLALGSPAPRPHNHVKGTESTLKGTLLHLLDCNGPMSTADLADACHVSTKAVWGVLKGPRDTGQVSFHGGLWALDRDFPGNDVLRAIQLLRNNGHRVEAPRNR